MPAVRRCLGCRIQIRSGSRCGRCYAEQKAPYTSAEYKRNRVIVLRRDNYTCQKMRNGRKCCRPATTADHIIPLDQGGRSTVANMEAACGPCNSAKRNR
jgi:5-methylcytosine-specific restriction endonuclease McrA